MVHGIISAKKQFVIGNFLSEFRTIGELGEVTATGLEPRTTWFLNEHSTIWPNWP